MSSFLIEGDDGDYIDMSCKIPFDYIEPLSSNPNVLMVNENVDQVTPFQELDEKVGSSLISPLTGQCFDHVRILS